MNKAEFVERAVQDISDADHINELFMAVFEHSGLGISICDENRVVISANRTFHELLNHAPGELEQLSFNDLVHANDRQADLDHHKDLIDGNLNNYSLNARLIQKNGAIVWVNNAVSAYRNENGGIKFIVVISRVVTDEIEKEAQAAVSAALDDFPLSVFLVDIDGHVRAMNSSARGIVAQNDGLSINNDKKLIVESTADQQTFMGLIQRVATNDEKNESEHSGGVFNLQRPSMRRAYSVLITPVRGGAKFNIGDRKPGALIYITDPEQAPTTPTEILCSLYGLTPAEAQITAEIVGGKNMGEIAEEFDINQHTIKSRLKRIFIKTETQGQSDLIRLILRSPAFIRNPDTKSEDE